MNLSYNILWIEDNEEFIQSLDIDEVVRSHVEGEGFDLHIEYRTQPDDIKREVDGTKFDLLVIDYNIAEGDLHGSEVIRQVRNKNCLTEVIFYSTDSPARLREIACQQELEGVFFSGREQEHLLPKIKDVFDLTVRKVVDVENMRGIVMAGVADLDHLVSDVVRAVHLSLDQGKQTELCKRLLAKMRPAIKSMSKLVQQGDHASFTEVEKLLDAIVELDPKDLETLLQARLFDSHKKVEMATSLCKDHEHLKPYKADIESIKDLLKWRNALAHQREVAHDSGYPVFEIDGTPEAFNATRTLSLRQQLRKQRQVLVTALEAVRKG